MNKVFTLIIAVLAAAGGYALDVDLVREGKLAFVHIGFQGCVEDNCCLSSATHRKGQGSRQGCLADPRHVLDQHMSPRPLNESAVVERVCVDPDDVGRPRPKRGS